jgi:hypothetical protein
VRFPFLVEAVNAVWIAVISIIFIISMFGMVMLCKFAVEFFNWNVWMIFSGLFLLGMLAEMFQ